MSMIISLFNEYWLHVGFFWALTIACWLLSGGLEKRNGFPWRVCFSVAAFHIMGYFGMPWLTRINIQLIQWTAGMEWLHVGLDRASGVCFRAASDLL